jgi:hypothetical protein
MTDRLIVSSEAHPSNPSVATPLDAITRLEDQRIRTVVLAGSFAQDRELASFLRDFYPDVRVACEV